MTKRPHRATTVLIWGGCLLFLLLGGILYSRLREPNVTALELARREQELARTVLENAPSRGADEAGILLVEFGDFQCPYCRDIAPDLTRVLEEFPNDLRHVWIHTPDTSTHSQAFQASVASYCAQKQGRFWEYHDRLFENQAILSTALMNQIAMSLRLDMTLFQDCLASEEARRLITQNIEFSAAQGVEATPHLLVNNEVISGSFDYDELKAIIQRMR